MGLRFESSNAEAEGYRFGQFYLDHQNHLYRNQNRVHIQHQLGIVLRRLLETPGRLVCRQSLIQLLWSEKVYVNFEHCLSSIMNRLRATLGESGLSPRYIETIPHQGYSFIAQVVKTNPAQESRRHPPETRLRPSALVASFDVSGYALKTAKILKQFEIQYLQSQAGNQAGRLNTMIRLLCQCHYQLTCLAQQHAAILHMLPHDWALHKIRPWIVLEESNIERQYMNEEQVMNDQLVNFRSALANNFAENMLKSLHPQGDDPGSPQAQALTLKNPPLHWGG